MFCVFVCFATLLSLTVPVYAAGKEIGTNVSVMVDKGFAITAQTEDFTLAVGGSQQLRITVNGIAPFNYLWEVSADGGASWSGLLGAGNLPSYTITNAQANVPANLAYQYKVTVTNTESESRSAVIKVLVSNDYQYRTSTDVSSHAANPPTVSGYLHDSTVLHVIPVQPQTDLSPSVWAAMSAQIGTGETYIEPHNIYFTNSAGATVMYHGELKIQFQVGAAYNGMTVKVVHYHAPTGTVEILPGTVANGVVTVKVQDLCPFMVVVPQSTVHVINASAGTGGSISPAGNVNVGHGGGMYFYFVPNSGYTLDKVLVDGVETAVAGNRYQFTNVTERHTISASFKASAPPPTTYYTITASSGTGGHISPIGSIQVAEGGSQTFSLIPNTGYEIDKVLIDGIETAVAGNAYRFTNVRANHSVSASFKRIDTPPITYHTITASAGKNGSISPVGNVYVASGDAQTFYLIANEGYEIDTLTVDGSAVAVEGGSYRFTNIRANHTIHVTYKEQGTPAAYHTITATAGAGGKISPSGSMRIVEGGDADFYFIPDEGYEVSEVLVDAEAVRITGNVYRFESVSAEHTVHVSFRKSEATPDTFFTVTASAGEHGKISPAGELQVAAGGSQTFYFFADTGYEIEAVYINGEKLDTVDHQYTVDHIDGELTVRVTFKPVGTAEPVDVGAACHCPWERLFGHCAICGWFGRCIAPWCLVVPLLILAAAGIAVWLVLRKKNKDAP